MMSKSMMNFTKGIITGVVVGTTVSMVMRGRSGQHHSNKNGAGKMIKNIGTVMSHFNDMMR